MEPDWDLTATILRFVTAGIAVIDPDGRILLANDAFNEMCGGTDDELPDFKTLLERLFPDDESRERVYGIFEGAIAGEISGTVEFTMRHGEGTPLSVDIVSAPVVNKNGRIVAVGIAFFDISERKRIENQRRDMELEYLNASRAASLGELASGIAHSINNPLAGILGYLGLLAEDYPDDERVKKCIAQSKRIGDLTQNLSYHGRNALMMGSVKFDANELVRETLILLSSSKLFGVIEIETDLNPDPVIINANPGDLTLVLINVLRNARDVLWGKTGGRIRIQTSKSGSDAVISVSDNGAGIPEEHRDLIFEPFFSTKPRVPESDSSPSGNGLGLSTSKHLVESNGGRIEFDTEVGKGTTFRLIFASGDN